MQNEELTKALIKKIYWLEKRIASAQSDVWLFKQLLENDKGNKPLKKSQKVEQLQLFTG